MSEESNMSPTISMQEKNCTTNVTNSWRETSSPSSESLLVESVVHLYEQINALESLKPSNAVNSLLTQLVHICTRPIPIDINNLTKDVKDIRHNLILLCAEAEYLLESHYSLMIGHFPHPLTSLHVFPYYSNYFNLASMEFNTLSQNGINHPRKLAFIGSGPLPISSIVLAMHHMPSTLFENYDMNLEANSMANKLVVGDSDLSMRMRFHTQDINHVRGNKLEEYDVVIIAALVGLERDEKKKIIEVLARSMRPGAALLMRSAKGGRSFLYPIVEEEDLIIHKFEILSIVHPTNEVINSIILALKSNK